MKFTDALEQHAAPDRRIIRTPWARVGQNEGPLRVHAEGDPVGGHARNLRGRTHGPERHCWGAIRQRDQALRAPRPRTDNGLVFAEPASSLRRRLRSTLRKRHRVGECLERCVGRQRGFHGRLRGGSHARPHGFDLDTLRCV
jgi:hypothetical protein